MTITETALVIIAVMEVVRAFQNLLQIAFMSRSNQNEQFARATDEFVKSLNKTDKEFVEELLNEIKESEN